MISIAVMIGTHLLYYPKWDKSGTEATLSWDVSGYYLYLPATFIYKDLRNLGFANEILKTYHPTPDLQQAYVHEASGNYVMKYSIGQAIILSPGFFIAHLWATWSASYLADGFSFPYQFSISMWVLLITMVGLVVLRKALLTYFNEIATGLSILGLVLGSNYLNYGAIDGAMTHNTLFTVYALLSYTTIRFYDNPTLFKAFLIGFLVGLAALTRPTEIIAMIIPVLWGVNLLSKKQVKLRLHFFQEYFKLLIFAVITCVMVGAIQLVYWKYVSGDWIVYSYGDQGFSWLKPHLIDGIFSYKSGWLTYTPFMVFALIGFYHLYGQQRSIFFATTLFCILFIYIAFAWDEWWYGGALGQRAMVQSYAVFAFPLAAFFTYLLNATKWVQVTLGLLIGLFVYTNLWWTHQAHLGGMLHVGQMRKAYFWKVLLTNKSKPENLKLLDDVNELYEGEVKDAFTIYRDSTSITILNSENQFSPLFRIPVVVDSSYDWLRVSADFKIDQKEWFFWTMTQFIVEVYHQDQKIGNYMIRVQRHMNDQESKKLYIDIPNLKKPISELQVKFWNAGGHKRIEINNLKVEIFDE
ncbi:hypothetical protein [Portibacter marinus]|uniref:hypothetical protein n=1 Tax=Portibacter marinus TaxID=2898660 RepID=UPI001F31E375|nr:hypothetical protein [Portibacter marinus]